MGFLFGMAGALGIMIFVLIKGFDSHQGKIFAEFKIWQMSEAQARASHRNKPTRIRYVDLDRFCRERRYLILQPSYKRILMQHSAVTSVFLNSLHDSGSVINQ